MSSDSLSFSSLMPNEAPVRPSSKLDVSEDRDLVPEDIAFIEELVKTDSDSQRRLSPVALAARLIQTNIRYRLAGWSAEGEKIPWDEEIETVRAIEEPLVIDPEKVQEEFRHLKPLPERERMELDKLDPKKFPFIRKGGHVNLASKEKLLMVRRAGVIILAELVLPDGTVVPIGHTHGLDRMPYRDNEFPNLDASSLLLPAGDKEKAINEKDKTTAIWRTSVRETLDAPTLQQLGINLPELSLRRLAIGSALKYIIIRQAQLRHSVRVTLNVGTLKEIDGDCVMQNAASDRYNRNFLRQWGWRDYITPIEIHGQMGKRVQVATMNWLAYTGKPEEAIQLLSEKEGVLKRKNIQIEPLEEVSHNIVDQLKSEQAAGEHE